VEDVDDVLEKLDAEVLVLVVVGVTVVAVVVVVLVAVIVVVVVVVVSITSIFTASLVVTYVSDPTNSCVYATTV